MDGHRRRAQRMPQDVQEQPEREEDLQPQAPQAEADAQEPTIPSGKASPRRRRAAQHMPVREVEEAAGKTGAVDRITSGQQEAAAGSAEPEKEAEGQTGKTEKRAPAAKKPHGERLKAAADVSAKAGKKAIEGLGGLLVLAMMLISEGLVRLKAAAGKLLAGVKSLREKQAEKKNESSSAQQPQEYELELIRPEDYHGRGQAHAGKTAPHGHAGKPDAQQKAGMRGKTAERSRALMMNRLASAVLLCVALVSAWQIGSIILRSVRTHRLNDELSRQRAAVMETADAQQTDEAPEQLVQEVEVVDMPAQEIEPAAEPAPEPTPEPESRQPEATPAPDVVRTTKYRRMGGDALPEMAALYEKNRDLVAWIQIPDVLDLPVVYRDNSYYLTRDFNKQKNASGTIFLDENHPFKEKTQNLLLHGHNMKDGTMFGRLAQYLHDDTYIRNHPFIYFDTLWNKEQYVIFAILNVSLDTKNSRFFNYFTHDTFTSDAEFQAYMRQLQLRSYYAIPIDVQPSDALLTLSTCLEEDRLVIVARRLREDETRSELRTLIRMTTKQ